MNVGTAALLLRKTEDHTNSALARTTEKAHILEYPNTAPTVTSPRLGYRENILGHGDW